MWVYVLIYLSKPIKYTLPGPYGQDGRVGKCWYLHPPTATLKLQLNCTTAVIQNYLKSSLTEELQIRIYRRSHIKMVGEVKT